MNRNCMLPYLKIMSGMTNIITAVMLIAINFLFSQNTARVLLSYCSTLFSPKVVTLQAHNFRYCWYHDMEMEDLTSNMTIAVIMVYPVCNEMESLLEKN